MKESGAWKALANGDRATPVVLAVDFDTTGRPEATFAALAGTMNRPEPIWHTLPPAPGSPEASTGAGYVEHWIRDLAAERAPVKAVLGFCAGSVYAAALADRIAAWQDPPLVVIFDPELLNSQILMWQFQKVSGFMAGTLSAAEIAEARRIGQQAFEYSTGPVDLKDRLITLMHDFGDPALARAGLDATRRAELFGVFSGFLGYLALASELDPRERWREAVAFSSNTPLSGLNAMRANGVEVAVAKEVHCPVEHAGMLADRRLAEAVAELLDN
ncbi:hypothetical protein [Micromonospora endolithica]|uniref:Alpha/beta hydrolase n=1 Tax=Micromonospora endolithica TaxID=230091 RepID=A0A3A9ZGZ5_9ACTN|nr:hypothetical protein [Micromonospora endolithica]RKN47499.1 hypothetical protein D7223_11970 [Micromonospora endolithica]TWJ21134.1 hypothetical protein JD76_01244 [Micromonospora endolithica]